MGISANLHKVVRKFQGTVLMPMSPRGQQEFVELDVTIRRRHEDPGQASKFPVEGGQDSADNYHRDPSMLTVDGILTDTPLRFGAGFSAGPRRAVEMWNQLSAWQNSAELLLVSMRSRTYEDMVIESSSVNEDSESGSAIWVSLSLVHISILEGLTLPADFDLDAKLAGAGGTTDMGTQNPIDQIGWEGPVEVI